MSYFDDNEDRIVFGPGRKELMKRAQSIDTKGWRTAAGRYITLQEASTDHLANMYAKLEREARASELRVAIAEELKRRNERRDNSNI